VIVDASALVAILRNEPETEDFVRAIDNSLSPRISAGNFLEAAIVVDRARNPLAVRRLDDLMTELRLAIEPVTEEQARIARQAYRDYGRGSGHPARLNFGDCFAYALARATGEKLLFKGSDFVHTDIASALD
jgi:ribonuclease VapC